MANQDKPMQFNCIISPPVMALHTVLTSTKSSVLLNTIVNILSID